MVDVNSYHLHLEYTDGIVALLDRLMEVCIYTYAWAGGRVLIGYIDAGHKPVGMCKHVGLLYNC